MAQHLVCGDVTVVSTCKDINDIPEESRGVAGPRVAELLAQRLSSRMLCVCYDLLSIVSLTIVDIIL